MIKLDTNIEDHILVNEYLIELYKSRSMPRRFKLKTRPYGFCQYRSFMEFLMR